MLQLNEKLISLDVEAESAEAAIRSAGALLVEENIVEERYVDAMVKGFQDIGPYIVLAPSIAIPHARPEHGVLQQSVSLVRLKIPVKFGHPTNDPVQLVCAISGIDSTSHIGMLQSLASVLGDKTKLEIILSSNNKEEIISIFN
ncbi:PTS sugar transporter subunit IIA [Bacillus canaveralius]|uniref:PTS sugar transporter subunit IIA n=1 Tax=Bacillus canaveralius TaxID=1403243 RepID=A0A2N5GJZ7_9BACI|nr:MULTISPECIES: PTS sugar transporter subunit IIA [Bacillus]PLR81650.1 PTS sugar transporter subunit IIA [Bacillus canaveralius]PLR87716.1 PTS sugar transporter subunit IIA [Bacillus sp. V33-4]PLR89886.1 PTS sugar transporter subunit IIA [Bacillus canaveralius]